MRKYVVFGPKGGLVGRGTAQAVGKAMPALLAKFKRVRVQPAAAPAPTPSPAPAPPITMFDDVTLSLLPAQLDAVAGYVNGRYANWPQIVAKYPHARKMSIAVSADADADCLDVERFDATPEQAPGWVVRRRKQGATFIAIYGSVSNWAQIRAAFKAAGLTLNGVKVVTAHYTGVAHRCTAACDPSFEGEADATQYTDTAFGRSLDETLCAPNFF